MRFLRFIFTNLRAGFALVVLAFVALFLLRLAAHTRDADVTACHARGGEVVTDEYPQQADVHRCVKDDRTLAAWKRVGGRNVLIIDWTVDW